MFRFRIHSLLFLSSHRSLNLQKQVSATILLSESNIGLVLMFLPIDYLFSLILISDKPALDFFHYFLPCTALYPHY